MDPNTGKLASDLLTLPQEDREYLAEKLVASLEDPVLSAEWTEILDRRGREIEDGTVQCIPMEVGLAEVEEELDAIRRNPFGSAR